MVEDLPDVNTEWTKKEEKNLKVTKREAKKLRAWYLSFIWAALSGTAAICYAQPMSLLKTRMHINVSNPYRNTVRGEFSYIWKTYGFWGLYKGLSANLLRSMVYTSTRIGFFYMLVDLVRSKHNDNIEFKDLFAMGLASGAVAAFISVPMEVVFVRMAADERLPAKYRRSYKGVGDALVKIYQKEGPRSLWVGTGPSVIRGMLQNAISVGIYTELKWRIRKSYFFKKSKNDWKITTAAALISGAIASVVLSPFDLIKVRTQTRYFQKNTTDNSNNKKSHFNGSMIKTIKHIWKTEGLKPFYHGIIPTSLYFLPFSSSLFLCFEQMKKLGLSPVSPPERR